MLELMEVTRLTLNREKSHPRQEEIEGEEQDDHLPDKVMKQTNDETRSKGRPSTLLLRSNRFPMRSPMRSNKNLSLQRMIMGVKFYYRFSIDVEPL